MGAQNKTTVASPEEVRVSCFEDQLDIRMFSQGAGPAKVLMPTKCGLTLPIHMLPRLIEAMQAATAVAQERGLLDG
jgi:hypothetical protein